MLRRSFWNLFGVALPCFAIAASGTAIAQDKPADKPADKPKTDKPADKPKTDKPADKPKDEKKTETKSIVDTAMANKDCSTLVDLLKAAELVSVLQGDGPFTVFAPTNAAFDKLGKETLEGLKKDKAKLAGILKFHIANGNMTAADVSKAKTIKTMNGDAVITTKDKDVMFNGAKITTTDIKCKNGVIHVIDTVAMPTPEKPKQ